jgi:hypothetical protein
MPIMPTIHNAADYGGHPAPAGPALPNLINAVSILKSKSTSKAVLAFAEINKLANAEIKKLTLTLTF